MPRARIGGIEIHYEVHGEGQPLLLIEGLGYALWMWDRQIPELSRRFRVIAFDNRGAGHSDKPPGPYTIAQMAGDAVGLLDHLGVDRAHVLGISMGGMIAQELALNHPQRVWRMVLGCTTFGGGRQVPMPAETRAAMMTDLSHLPAEEALRRRMQPAFAPGWPEAHPEAFAAVVRRRLQAPQPGEAWMYQAEAALGHDTYERLPALERPVLVCAGDRDRVVPPENSRLLAERVPRARLEIFAGAGHLFVIERAQGFNGLVGAFLLEDGR